MMASYRLVLLFALLITAVAISVGSPQFLNTPISATTKVAAHNERRLRTFDTNMARGDLYSYYIEVTIGQQSFRVILDSGSSTLAIPGIGCSNTDYEVTCNDGGSEGGEPLYSPAQSPTVASVTCGDASHAPGGCYGTNWCVGKPSSTSCWYNISYGSDAKGMSGPILSDKLTIGSISAQTLFMDISQESSGSPDGIFGIGYNTAGMTSSYYVSGGYYYEQSRIPASLDGLLAANNLENSFSILLNYEGTGTFTLGGADPSLYNAPMLTTSLQTPYSYYYVAFTGFYIGGAQHSFSASAIVDSGTTLIYIPTAGFNTLMNAMLSQYPNLPGNTAPSSASSVWNQNTQDAMSEANWLTAAQVAQWPSISFTFNGLVVTLSPQNYFYGFGGGKYMFQILSTSGPFILGDGFLRGLYVHFDRGTNTIGFAQSAVADTYPGPIVSATPPGSASPTSSSTSIAASTSATVSTSSTATVASSTSSVATTSNSATTTSHAASTASASNSASASASTSSASTLSASASSSTSGVATSTAHAASTSSVAATTSHSATTSATTSPTASKASTATTLSSSTAASSSSSSTSGSSVCGTQSACVSSTGQVACYNSAQYSCNNGYLCPLGYDSCANACYSPSQYKCVNNVLMGL